MNLSEQKLATWLASSPMFLSIKACRMYVAKEASPLFFWEMEDRTQEKTYLSGHITPVIWVKLDVPILCNLVVSEELYQFDTLNLLGYNLPLMGSTQVDHK